MTARASFSTPWAGMVSGPLAWALSFQGNFLLAEWQCAHGVRPVPFVALALAVLSLAGGFVSWRAWRRPTSELDPEERAATFVAAVGTLMAVLFALGILLQAGAGTVFTGCER